MSDPNESLEESLFQAALEKPSAAERAAFLDAACRDHPELRARLEILLEGCFRAEGFLPDQPAGQPPLLPVNEKPGDRIGRYKLLQKIGEGGMGVVYMAGQEEPVRRKVALKVIKLGMDTNQVVARFEAERQALALMDHPNIARVLDGGATDAGRPFFVMELVQGVPITEFCDKNNLSAQERIKLFMPVCQAIQSAHQKGIIHRDLKPTNILVTLNAGVPHPMVIDFGVAKATNQKLTEKTVFTNYATMIGTPAYMSPEQAEMSRLDVDTRADIYGLGVLLYELLTGTTPFPEKRLRSVGYNEMQRIIMEEEPERPSTRLRQKSTMASTSSISSTPVLSTNYSRLSTDLDWIVMKCLEKDRARRYETANGLATDLQRHLNHEPVAARPPSRLYELEKIVRRHWVGFCAASAVLAALALGATVSTWQAVRASRQSDLAKSSRREATLAQMRAEAGEQAARENLYAADMNLAQEVMLAGNRGLARSLIEAHRPQPGQPDLRGFEWRYLWALLRGDELACLGTNDSAVTSVAISPDGRTLATISQTGPTWVWDLNSRKVLAALPDFGAAIASVAFSPDGAVLAVGSSQHLSLFNAKTWQRLRDLPCDLNPVLAFSPAGRCLACGMRSNFPSGNGGNVVLFDYATGERAAHFPGAGGQVAFSPDGKWLAMGPSNGVATVMDVATRQTIASVRPGSNLWAMAFTPDGHQLVTSCFGETEVKVWDLSSQRLFRSLPGHTSRIWDITFSPDGQTMATASSDQTVRLWDVATWSTREILRGHGRDIWTVAFTPDGQHLVTGATFEPVMLWPVRVNRPKETIENVFSRPIFSPDGSLFAAIGASNTLTLFRTDIAEPIGVIEGRNQPLVFLPNGRTLVTVGDGTTLRRWDTGTRSFLSETKLAGTNHFSCFHLSPDGATLVTGSRSPLTNNLTAQVWDAHTGTLRVTLGQRLYPRNAVSFSPDGRWLATGCWSEVFLWNAHTLEPICKLWKPGMFIGCLAFSPDSRLLAAGRDDGTVNLWDASSHQLAANLDRQAEGVDNVSFSPDSKTLAVYCVGNVALWNLAARYEVGRLPYEGSPTFSPDGRLLVIYSADSKLHLLRAPLLPEIQMDERRLFASP
jgi:eukaryotic-like serine/threonine-protein kinase